jgi:ketosteroid isomerase-like protein
MTSRTILTFAVLLAAAACNTQPAATFTAEDEVAIRAVLDQWASNTTANRFMENLDLYTEDSAELLATPREGKSAIRERWGGFADDLQFTDSDLNVREIIGMGDVAYTWIEFSNTYEADGEPWVQSGTWMVLFRRSPEGVWRIHRNMWNATTSADTTAMES